MKIPFNNLKKQNDLIKKSFIKDINLLFQNNDYILGKNVELFEKSFNEFINVDFSVGVSSGTDAIKLAIRSLNFNPDETLFITQANTFIATVIAIKDAYNSANIKLVDVDEYYQIDCDLLEDCLKINKKKYKNIVVIPVSMFGHPFNKEKMNDLKEKYNLTIIEDSSQSHGSKFKDNSICGSFGDLSAFSLYPGKNLGAVGDAGIVCTNNLTKYNTLISLRNYGSPIKYQHDIFGYNCRMDTIQSYFLIRKLKHINDFNNKRNKIATLYLKNINNKLITNFKNADYCGYNSYHIYPIRCQYRESLINYLNSNNIQYGIHYPIPIECTPAFSYLNEFNKNTRQYSKEILSLPIHPFMTKKEALYVINTLNKFSI